MSTPMPLPPRVVEGIGQRLRSLGSSVRLLIPFAAALIVTVAACVLLAVTAESAQHGFSGLAARHPYWALALPPLVFPLLLWLTLRLAPVAAGGGVAQVLALLSQPRPSALGRLGALRIVAARVVLTASALGAGASLGREGPGAQLGAMAFHGLGPASWYHDPGRYRLLLVYGSVAGIAATFGTPLAAVLFAIEALRARMDLRGLCLALLVAVAAAAMARSLLPGIGVLAPLALPTVSAFDLGVSALACGMLAGILGGGFSRGLPALLRLSMPRWRRYPLRIAALCGAILALLGYWGGAGIQGSGLLEVRHWLAGDLPQTSGFAGFKLVATAFSAVAMLPGGLISPLLAAGAGLGVDLSRLIDGLPAATAIALGMAAFPAAVTRAPLAAMMLVVELLHVPALVPALLAASLIASTISAAICRPRLFEVLSRSAAASP